MKNVKRPMQEHENWNLICKVRASQATVEADSFYMYSAWIWWNKKNSRKFEKVGSGVPSYPARGRTVLRTKRRFSSCSIPWGARLGGFVFFNKGGRVLEWRGVKGLASRRVWMSERSQFHFIFNKFCQAKFSTNFRSQNTLYFGT